MTEQKIEGTDLLTLKNSMKTSVWNEFFKEMQAVKSNHKKVNHIPYNQKRKSKPCLTNSKLKNEMSHFYLI